jgi:uncharacterized protein YcbK (DUF882 family)
MTTTPDKFPDKQRYSAHFLRAEMHDGGVKPGFPEMESALAEVCARLEKVRADLGNKPIIVTSGYRTPDINAACGGARYSYHMSGRAADIQVKGITPVDLAKICKRYFMGVITYPQHVHVDTRVAQYWALGEYRQ